MGSIKMSPIFSCNSTSMLFLQFGDLITSCFSCHIPVQTLLASFHKLFVPGVELGLGDAVLSTQFCHRGLGSKPLHNDQNLLFGGKDPARILTNIFYK